MVYPLRVPVEMHLHHNEREPVEREEGRAQVEERGRVGRLQGYRVDVGDEEKKTVSTLLYCSLCHPPALSAAATSSLLTPPLLPSRCSLLQNSRVILVEVHC
jgi:hypothetical protein